jgi:hypothetical protein
MSFPSSVKVTVPPSTVPLVGVTVAVRVTGALNTDGLADDATVVIVAGLTVRLRLPLVVALKLLSVL